MVMSMAETNSYTKYISFITKTSNSLDEKTLLSFYNIINVIILHIIFLIDIFY